MCAIRYLIFKKMIRLGDNLRREMKRGHCTKTGNSKYRVLNEKELPPGRTNGRSSFTEFNVAKLEMEFTTMSFHRMQLLIQISTVFNVIK